MIMTSIGKGTTIEEAVCVMNASPTVTEHIKPEHLRIKKKLIEWEWYEAVSAINATPTGTEHIETRTF